MTPDHYFDDAPNSPSKLRELKVTLRGEAWWFTTDRGVFSPTRLDPGSRVLLEAMVIPAGAQILDAGAGYGPLGLVAARLAGPEGHAHLVEVNARAAELSRMNATRNRVENVTVHTTGDLASLTLPPMDIVLCNPPSHAGYQVVFPLLDAAAATLAPGGRFWLVGYKHLGVKTLEKHLGELLGPIDTVEKSGGYRVLVGTRARDEG